MQKTRVRIEPADPLDQSIRVLLDVLSRTLEEITGSSGAASFDVSDVAQEGALFVAATDIAGGLVGCGAYRPLSDGVAELKRMYAVPGSKGVGAALLGYLESAAKVDGYRELWLETRVVNTRAVEFYTRHGYRQISNFGKYIGRSDAVCLGKPIT